MRSDAGMGRCITSMDGGSKVNVQAICISSYCFFYRYGIFCRGSLQFPRDLLTL